LRPEALPHAAAGCRVAAILCSPALHNPTNASMSLARRREVLRIADQLGALIIEDDSSGHLSGDETPTMASLERQRCIYVCGTSKSIAPGLRIGLWPGERR
jgi:DNA-binding transcriptional MocR family regulator